MYINMHYKHFMTIMLDITIDIIIKSTFNKNVIHSSHSC